MPTTIHHPKGSMCAVCIHKCNDCSSLNFGTMPVKHSYNQDMLIKFKVVICNQFVKSDVYEINTN